MFHSHIVPDELATLALEMALVEAGDSQCWSIEVYGREGWKVRRSWFSGEPTFGSYADAVEAAVQLWQRTDRPARPCLRAAAGAFPA